MKIFWLPAKARISLTLILFCWTTWVVVAQLPPGFIREQIATGLNPTSLSMAPDGRIFITEKHGTIRIVRNDHLLDEPFLTLEVDDDNERGLGHMVHHPQFEENGYVYVFYSVPGTRRNRVGRFTAIGDKVIPGSEHLIIELDQAGSDVHNGGDMVFGFDGHLYIATGDGGQDWRGEDPGSTHAKVLRIDEEGHPLTDNPFYPSNYLRTNYVYAYGLRNPFTLTQHPLTGDIYFNDVGSNKYEEVNRVVKGGFYGWPRLEGKRTNQEVLPNYQDPVYAYGHFNGYCCIVGASFYCPSTIQFPPHYFGKYFFSDYCTGRIRVLNVDTGLVEETFIQDGDRVIDIEVSPDGALYYLERKGIGDGSPEDNTGTQNGTLWKVTYTGSGAPFISTHPQSVLLAIGEDATFDVSALGAQPLTFSWYINDVLIQQGAEDQFRVNDVMMALDSARIWVEVANAFDMARSDTALLRVTSNHRPQAIITSPVEEATYAAGEEILFSGIGEDVEEGNLPAEALSWRIDFHHGTHSHPAMPWTSGISSGSYYIPSTGETSEDVWFRIYLRASDSEGLSQLAYRDVWPRIGNIYVDAIPTGLAVRLDGASQPTPFNMEGVRGVTRFLSSPKKQVFGDSVYFFTKWSDGIGTLLREVQTEEHDQTYTALFSGIAKGQGSGLTVHYYDTPVPMGSPVASTIDPIIDHNYFLDPPYPGVPKDYFSIQWEGYVQAYRSGDYVFSIIADDGFQFVLNHQVFLEELAAGFHFVSDTIYLEGGRLYPIRLQLREELWGAQMQLRWSGVDFDEEIVPTSQLYPIDFLSSPTASGVLLVETLVDQHLQLSIESFRNTTMNISIMDIQGRIWRNTQQYLPAGRNLVRMSIDFLPPGVYYFSGKDSAQNKNFLIPFVKVR